ncbi:MAG: hypothetical protein A2583_14350 [Bdellovibrionales bacterium RIFOXYD1_FULL_53_11]|nr:MAG: hypothetical protein A2583_14350 [Bdellovibrionales bacterium RIFOXYD1_FULL_53_11]
MKTTLIMPTLNEIDGVKALMPRIKREWFDEIIVVDGGSTDGTCEWLAENNWRVIKQEKPGIGNAYRQAHAVSTGDVLVTFSPDGNSDASRIPALLDEMRKGHDMVIVSRYKDWAKSEDDDFLTAFGNKLFTFIINTLFGGSYSDTLVIFRAYKRDLLQRLEIDAPHLTYDAQISIRAAKMKVKVSEIPGNEPKRIGGNRKMNPFFTGGDIVVEILKNLFWAPASGGRR